MVRHDTTTDDHGDSQGDGKELPGQCDAWAQTPHWVIQRYAADGAPRVMVCMIGSVRLQIFRHIAHPGRWVAASCGIIHDLLLSSITVAEAQEEALQQVRSRIAPPVAVPGDLAVEVAR